MTRYKLSHKQLENVRVIHTFEELYGDHQDLKGRAEDTKALYPVWMEALKVWFLFAPLLVITLAVLYAEFGFSKTWYAMGFSLMPVLSTILRRKTSHIVVFILGSAVMASWIFLAPEFLMKLMGIAFCIALFCYGIVRKSSRSERPLTVVYMGFMLVLMTIIDLVMLSRGYEAYQSFLLLQGLAFTGLFLFLEHRSTLVDSLHTINKAGNTSIRRMVRFNSLLFWIFFLLIGAVFYLLYELRLGTLLSLLVNYLLLGGRKLVRSIFSILPTAKALEQEAAIMERTNADIIDLLGGQTVAFWEITQRILVVLTIAVGIVMAGWLMYQMYKRFGHRDVYRETNLEVWREFYSSGLSRSAKKERITEPGEPLRRKYYHLVKDEMGEKVQPSDTPTVVADKIPEVKNILIDYEQVRYGNQETTKRTS